MTNPSQPDITGILAAWNKGEDQALSRVIEIVYPELRRIARQHLRRRRPGESLQSGDLADEAYLKLQRAQGIPCESRVHFLALCSQIIRRILVDHVRRLASQNTAGKSCAYRLMRCCLWLNRAV